jgi:predicted SAM-dependent methyltransferase
MKSERGSGVKLLDWMRMRMAALRHRLSPPAYPVNPDGRRFVHLGCGATSSPEFINVDVRPLAHIHHAHDVHSLPMFEEGFADLVYACHVLEHVSFRRQGAVLAEWRRVLKPSGVLRLSVPDFDLLVRIYHACADDVTAIMPMLLGNQDYASNYHFGVFTRRHLTRLMTDCGFRHVREWDPRLVEHHEFDDWASRPIAIGGASFPVSLNLEGVK